MKTVNKNLFKNALLILLISAIVGVLTYFSFGIGKFIGIAIFGQGLLPILLAFVLKIDIKRMAPDIIFGIVDNLILIIPAIIGAEILGALGALVGAVVGNAISDAIAGFFEGWISQWLRTKNIDEARTPIGSSLGKMSGCLFVGIGLLFY
ncbi:MAG: hypothetical protein M1371_03650 [Actinobacteria bacterium]|nr:hypothetical protein [Actinomycetota bacterium]